MKAKSNRWCFGVRAWAIAPGRQRFRGWWSGWWVDVTGSVGECRRPPSVLDLANNRVLPNSPHASSGGGWAGRPCSESGFSQGGVGFAPPATSVALSSLRHHPRSGGDGRVPGDTSGDHDE
jgi:hypothetical protein